MTTIAELVGPEVIQDLATPSTVRLGRALAADGEVTLETTAPERVEGRVGGGRSGTQRRRVAMWSQDRALAWSCTCTSNADLFCKHLVAAAICLRDGGSGRDDSGAGVDRGRG